LYVEELVQKSGKFAPTRWNERASVEIRAEGSYHWFLHALTGGEWLLELYFTVPRGVFKKEDLVSELKLKTLDERDDLETYGNWQRVDVRHRWGGLEAVVVYVYDRAEIDTPAFRRMVKRAIDAYLSGVAASDQKTASQ
jgi:excinuclease ABC subunit A